MSKARHAALEETSGERRPTPGVPAPAATVRVSVVIPARDEAAYIGAALASVLAQTYPLNCLECVVVDNGSADTTAEVAHDFAQRHPELAVAVVAEPLPGVARAKNRGARAATGAILIFLDADSRMTPNLVREIVARWRRSAPAGCVRVVADSDDLLERGFFNLMEVGPILFGIRSQMPYCDAALFRAIGGFREELQLAEDLDFLRRARERLRRDGKGKRAVAHIRSSTIATSPRRLRTHPHHLSILAVFVRWALAFAGVGRQRRYS